MAEDLRDDPERLRAGVRANYRAVAADPRTIDYFHTGRHSHILRARALLAR